MIALMGLTYIVDYVYHYPFLLLNPVCRMNTTSLAS